MKCLHIKVLAHFKLVGSLLGLAIFLVVNLRGVAQTNMTYKRVDSLTYNLYEQAQWHQLITEGEVAIRNGFDYYYMRMRVGIAYYMRQYYRHAAQHFEKALVFSSSDTVAFDYLYQCYQSGGLDMEAASLISRFPVQAKTRSMSSGIVRGLSLFAGGAKSGSMTQLKNIDLDGDADIYGEVHRNGNLGYGHLSIILAPLPQFRWNIGYTQLQLFRHQQIVVAGEDIMNNYRLKQHQVFINFPFRFASGWQLVPVFDYLSISTHPLIANYDTVSFAYHFRKSDTSFSNYIASLKIIKDMPYLSLGFATGKSFLNNQNQWQATVITGVYPFANLNIYGFSRISALLENESFRWHFKINVGVKTLSKLWFEGSHHFGNLKNAWDENGLLVYNTAGCIISRSTFTAFILLNKELTLQLEYNLMRHEDEYLEYIDYSNYTWKPFQYNNHHIMGGIKWKI